MPGAGPGGNPGDTGMAKAEMKNPALGGAYFRDNLRELQEYIPWPLSSVKPALTRQTTACVPPRTLKRRRAASV